MSHAILRAPSEAGEPTLGRTIPDLLDEACRDNPNDAALNQFTGEGWESVGTQELCRSAEELALGLQSIGLEKGDRVALYMHSDVDFCLVDVGCILAGIVDVPIYLTHADEVVRYVLEHSGSRMAVATDRELLETLLPIVDDLNRLEYLLLAEEIDDSVREEVERRLEATQLLTVAELRARGAERLGDEPGAPRHLRERIDPEDLATIIYTSGTTGEPKGVELTHQNVTSNALDSFAGLSGLERGPQEVAISFLPLTHVFQRTMQYGFMNYGHTVYFTEPEDLGRDFPEVRPTIFATVPRILERVLEKIQMRGSELEGWRRAIFDFAMERARDHEVGRSYGPWDRMQHALADFFVYRRWRKAVGARTKFIISGGAALRPEIVELFDAAGITILQGYGLTETSPVISFNRPEDNRPGTVGVPIAGVEAKIAEDGEILTRGPHLMRGYYEDEAATREVIDEDGWFHTGDVGAIEDGHLRVTDRKKSLFKLSTGKYVIPQPLENSLDAEFLVERALVVGEGRKFCTALIFPSPENLRHFVEEQGLDPDRSLEELVEESVVQEAVQELVDRANEKMDPWSQIKYFTLIPRELKRDGPLMTPTLKLRRHAIVDIFSEEIDRMYEEAEEQMAAEPEDIG